MVIPTANLNPSVQENVVPVIQEMLDTGKTSVTDVLTLKQAGYLIAQWCHFGSLAIDGGPIFSWRLNFSKSRSTKVIRLIVVAA